MRTVGLMIVKNELDRYLERSLTGLAAVVDKVVVVDDHSTDGSLEFVSSHPSEPMCVRRPSEVPSFVSDERTFRQWAWSQAVLHEDDVIFVVDADEQLAAEQSAEPEAVRAMVNTTAETVTRGKAAFLPIIEIWAVTPPLSVAPGRLQHRTDGEWGRGRAQRVATAFGDQSFGEGAKGRFGCGAIPERARSLRPHQAPLRLVHYGYATQSDREARHDRYRKARGHSPSHIESIMALPRLAVFDAPGLWELR